MMAKKIFLILALSLMIPRMIVPRYSTNQAKLVSTLRDQGSAQRRGSTASGMLAGTYFEVIEGVVF